MKKMGYVAELGIITTIHNGMIIFYYFLIY